MAHHLILFRLAMSSPPKKRKKNHEMRKLFAIRTSSWSRIKKSGQSVKWKKEEFLTTTKYKECQQDNIEAFKKYKMEPKKK